MMTWLKPLRKKCLLTACVVGLSAWAGCGPTAPPAGSQPVPSGSSATTSDSANPSGASAGTRSGSGNNPIVGIPVANDEKRYRQAFEDAVRTDVPEGQHRPPDDTLAGKSTGKLRSEVEKIWSKIPLLADGKTIPYVIQLETKEGVIEITLRPEIAPNHVRHFVALTRVGFYDGLCFERIIRQESESDGVKSRLDLVTAGCPAGSGDEGIGHIGYFLRGEMDPTIKHEEGSVGFWYDGEDSDAAGTRFYITLGTAPVLDGEYTIVGKVTKGLDLVRKIASAPVQGQDPPENQKPIRPVRIKKASVQPDLLDKSLPVARGAR